MGRFHRHSDGTAHAHDHDGDHTHDHREVGDHSGYATGTERVEVLELILDENDSVAHDNRHALAHHGVRTVNLMSSPGAGKTSLLQHTIPAMTNTRIGILEGDIATSLDADALTNLGAQVALVNTSAGFGGECHLDAVMVKAGLDRLDLDAIDLLVIENVGNLVCPAEFDVGQDARAMVYAITEGEDTPLKYPVMFRSADAIVVNKIDLLPHLDFDLDLFYRNVNDVNPHAEIFEVSAKTGDGIDQWTEWLDFVATAPA